MSCMSHNFRLCHVSTLSVRNLLFFFCSCIRDQIVGAAGTDEPRGGHAGVIGRRLWLELKACFHVDSWRVGSVLGQPTVDVGCNARTRLQGRHHGFLSGGGGTNRRQGGQSTPKYHKNRKRHRIWATSFSSLGLRHRPNFSLRGTFSPLSTLHGCIYVCRYIHMHIPSMYGSSHRCQYLGTYLPTYMHRYFWGGPRLPNT